MPTPIAPERGHAQERHPSLEDATTQVPFDVKIPSDIPANYQLSSCTLIESPTNGGKISADDPMRVTGIALYYEDTSQEGGLTRDAIFFEQFLGTRYPGYQVLQGNRTGTSTILGQSADMWSVPHPKGTQTALVWDNEDDGVMYNMVTYLSPTESLNVARSLR